MVLKTRVHKLMTSHNFTLIRDKKHQVWKHTTGAQVVVSNTISDHRALKNIERDVRKVLSAVAA